MLKIRSDQLSVLDQDAERRYLSSLAADIRRLYPKEVECLSEVELMERLTSSLSDGKLYDLSNRDALALYIHLTFELGVCFELNTRNCWMLTILKNENLKQLEKMKLIFTRIDKQDSSMLKENNA